MAITTYKPKQILLNCPPEIAEMADKFKGKLSLTQYIVAAIRRENRRIEKQHKRRLNGK